jgi:hypothetical protein
MISIAVISNLHFSFDTISYDDIKSSKFSQFLMPYIRIIDIPNEQNKMEHIIPYIGGKDANIHRSYKCFEKIEYSTYLLYATIENNNRAEEINAIGKFLSERHEEVSGNCVLINSTEEDIIPITYDQVVDIIRSRIIHKAILVSPSDEIREITYISLPIENSPLQMENCRCVQIQFLTKVLCIFIEHIPYDDKMNKLATLICKKMKIHGNVVISMFDNYPSVEVIDLTKDTFNKILCVQSNTSIASENKLTDEAIQTSFFSVLQKYVEKYDKKICENIPPDVFNGPTMNTTLHE